MVWKGQTHDRSERSGGDLGVQDICISQLACNKITLATVPRLLPPSSPFQALCLTRPSSALPQGTPLQRRTTRGTTRPLNRRGMWAQALLLTMLVLW